MAAHSHLLFDMMPTLENSVTPEEERRAAKSANRQQWICDGLSAPQRTDILQNSTGFVDKNREVVISHPFKVSSLAVWIFLVRSKELVGSICLTRSDLHLVQRVKERKSFLVYIALLLPLLKFDREASPALGKDGSIQATCGGWSYCTGQLAAHSQRCLA